MQFLLSNRPQMDYFQNYFVYLGYIFAQWLVRLNNCGFCTYANKNKYEQELFIVITIQSDTPASE